MGKRISFSMAWLDKETFITGACLWPKVLQDMIYSLEMFSSWSLPPTPHPPKKKIGECSRIQVPVAATCRLHTQLRIPWHCAHGTKDVCALASEESVAYMWQTRLPTGSGQCLSAAEHPSCCPRSRPSPEICRRWSVGQGPPLTSADFQSNCSCHDLYLL